MASIYDLTSAEKTNITLKQVFGVVGLSNPDTPDGLAWNEEKYGWLPFVLNQEIYMKAVPRADSAVLADANVDNILIEKRNIKLTPVNGTNLRGWAAYKVYNDPESGMYGDWLLPQVFGSGYAVKLFRDNGTGTAPGTVEITPYEGSWVPSYKAGLIVLSAATVSSLATLGWTTPLWVTAYRYIGPKGISGATSGTSLDDSYNNGSIITVDNGAVALAASNGYAPLQLTPIASVPTAGIAAGQLCNVDGTIFIYDGSRLKWLSLAKQTITYHANRGDGNYLNFGEFSDNAAGYVVPKNCTVVSISACIGRGNTSKAFYIQKNGMENTDIFNFNLSSGKFFASKLDVTIPGTPINIDFVQGDVIQVFCDSIGASCSSPRVNLELAWKLS